jgi:hypothetical protein
MIRLYVAAWLLRTAGFDPSYVVRRIYAGTTGRGTTVMNNRKFKNAKERYNAMRIADTDTITICIEADVAQRHGTVAAVNSVVKENEDE